MRNQFHWIGSCLFVGVFSCSCLFSAVAQLSSIKPGRVTNEGVRSDAPNKADLNVSVKVSGAVVNPLTLTKNDLASMQRTTAVLKNKQGQKVIYAGVKVQTILERAGVSFGKELRGKNLAKYLLVKSADGYEVVFSLAEIDNGFTNNLIILADQEAGAEILPERGPFRIIVETDKVSARSSFQVTEMIVRFAK
jgi:hypothetical protein